MEKQQGNGLIYGLNDKPPFKEAFFAALESGLSPEEQKKDKSTMPSSPRRSSLRAH